MSNFRRLYLANHKYFITIVTYKRKPILNDSKIINILKYSITKVMEKYPFTIDALVVLPDHLHMLIQMPSEDSNHSKRIRLIKTHFTKKIIPTLNTNQIWQPRYWEHCIRNECDYFQYLDYIHYNPVKHGYVSLPSEWPYSSLIKWIKKGVYKLDWGKKEPNFNCDIPE